MISSLQLSSLTPQHYPWVERSPFFQSNRMLTFKPGLNVVYGPNGSGKSTLISMLAMYLAAQQGGVSTVTETWIRDLYSVSNDLGYQLEHDGQPVMYFDGYTKAGLVGGNFDDDFFAQGLLNTINKGSHGELALNRLARILEVLNGRREAFQKEGMTEWGFPENIDRKIQKRGLNDTWGARLDSAEKLLVGTIPIGPKTILLDEPDTGFGLEWQERVWNGVMACMDAKKYQVIVATHSPFALGIQGANYIETVPGMVERATTALRKMAVWA